MSLSIQFLQFPEGFTRLKEEAVKEISATEKIFELVEPIQKRVQHSNGDTSFGEIKYLLLKKTNEKGIYEVEAFYPENRKLKCELGHADVRKYLEAFDF